MLVTARSDLRLLYPGLSRAASDLMVVAKKYVLPGHVVWDLGANLGVFSVCAAWRAGAAGSIFSVEADAYYVSVLQRTQRQLSSSYAPIRPICAAVAGAAGIVELCVSEKGHSRNHLSSVVGNGAGNEEFSKRVVSLTADFLLQQLGPPNFVKVDIEGAELEFLGGAVGLLRDARPLIYIEVCESNANEVTRVLQANRYELFAIDSEGVETGVRRCAFNTLAKPL